MTWIQPFVAATLLILAASPATTQSITDKQADEILTELRQIRRLLERLTQPPAQPAQPPPNERVKLPSISGPSLGRADAPVTMVEFTDLECPFCRQFHETAFQDIKKTYIDTGKLRFVTHDFPLGFHPNAKSAAVAARCGAEQGKFWELRGALSKNADKLSPQAVLGHAAGLGLDMVKFQACVDSNKFEAAIQKDIAAAAAAGVAGTPMFIIGKTNSTEEGWRISGAMPFAVFEERIKQLLEPSPDLR